MWIGCRRRSFDRDVVLRAGCNGLPLFFLYWNGSKYVRIWYNGANNVDLQL